MIYLSIATVALTWYLIWMNKHIGIPTSISSTFYHNKTRWTYTAVIGGIGAVMTFIDPHSILHYAGVSLVLGTAAPDFEDESSASMLLHFGFTGITSVLAFTYVFDSWWIGLAGGALIGGAKLLENKISNPVFWAEVILFYTTFIGIYLMK